MTKNEFGCYLYYIENMVNGKVYIGISNNPRKRWIRHQTVSREGPIKYREHSYIHNAIAKYGIENFHFNVVSYFSTVKEAELYEIFWISEMKRFDIQIYNLTEGGEGFNGYKYTDEDRQRMSERQKQRWKDGVFDNKRNGYTKDVRQQMSETRKQIMSDNKDRFDAMYLERCQLTLEECLDIQNKWINGIYMHTIANEFDVSHETIHKVIHGTYKAIEGKSLLTQEQIIEISLLHHKMSSTPTKLNADDKRNLVIDASTMTYTELSNKYGVHRDTIYKELQKYGITPIRGKSKPIIMNNELVQKVRSLYETNVHSQNELAQLFDVSLSTIANIIYKKGAYKDK